MRDREQVPKRPLWMVVVLLLLGAGALWASSRLAWSEGSIDGGVRGTVRVRETGAQRVPALTPLAFLALAGIAGMVATGGWARRSLAVLLALAGSAAIVLGVSALIPLGSAEWGQWSAVAGGLLLLAAAALAFLAARDMPRLGARYENPRAAEAPPAAGEDIWKALSEGQDPTTRE